MKITPMLFAAMLCGIGTYAQNAVECSYTSISSNITTNTTLSASTLYRLEGCIHVTSGHTLTIPAGTRIMGKKDASSPGMLIIDKGATLSASGTSSNPIIFTSDQTPTHKNPGDWAGIVIEGKATNNVSGGIISIENRACSIEGGVASGANDADNSGTLQYIRIEYATYPLTLLSVGNGTTIDHIQASYADRDAFQFLGGTVRAKYLVSLNAKGADILSKFGNRSLVQYVINLRPDAGAHTSSGDLSNSIVMGNNDNAGGGYAGTPANHPVFSNVSIMGPLYCGAGTISSDFKNAVFYYHNTQGGVYNSFVAGYPVGLRMEDATTLNNADANDNLLFSENSLNNNTTEYSNNGSWPGTCASNMTDWIKGLAGGSCDQFGNQFQSPSYTVGYSSTICGNYSTTTPTFVLGTTGLNNASFPSGSDLDNVFFTSTSQKHGALNTSTDWTTSWAEWNPQAFDPCPGMRPAAPTGIESLANENTTIQIAPNPSEGITYASFDAKQSGSIKITVVNSVGQVVRTVDRNVEKGSQRIAIKTEGLNAGMYTVIVETAKGAAMRSKLVIK